MSCLSWRMIFGELCQFLTWETLVFHHLSFQSSDVSCYRWIQNLLWSHLHPLLEAPIPRFIFTFPALYLFLLSFLFYPIRPCQFHPSLRPSSRSLSLSVSINQSRQWHVEFFITSPRGHHAACACVSCCFFFHSCLPSLTHSPSLCGIILSQPAASWVLLFCGRSQLYGVVVAVSDWPPLHGLSSHRLWLLHCGYHPAQDQPLQPGRTTLLPMGEAHIMCLLPCFQHSF